MAYTRGIMARLLITAVLMLVGVFTLADSDAYAAAEKRVALVVGSSEYKEASLALLNP